MTGTTRRHVTSDTMRRLYRRKAGCRLRIERRMSSPHNVWDRASDVEWQRGLTCEVRRVRK